MNEPLNICTYICSTKMIYQNGIFYFLKEKTSKKEAFN